MSNSRHLYLYHLGTIRGISSGPGAAVKTSCVFLMNHNITVMFLVCYF